MKQFRYFALATILCLAAWVTALGGESQTTSTQEDSQQRLIPKDPPPAFVDAVPTKAAAQAHSKKRSGDALQFSGNSPDVAIWSATDTTQSENSVFISPVDPDVVLNSNNSGTWPGNFFFGQSEAVSQDVGASWVSNFRQVNTSLYDPAVVINRAGRMFTNYIIDNPGAARGQGVSYSDDNGSTWNEVTITNPGGSILHDKNHFWVDNSVASPHEGNLYCAWTPFFGGNIQQVELSRSTDDGLTWSTPILLSGGLTGNFHHGVNIQTGPDGDVYVAWAMYNWPSNEIGIGFTRSTDGGATFSTPVQAFPINGHRLTALGGGKNMRHNSFPTMTVNQQNGHVYIAWTERQDACTPVEADIYMRKSTDNGATWSSPVRINQDKPDTVSCNGKDQWFPWIACDEISGAISCVFYDSRNFAANDRAETWVAISYDDGVTWSDYQISDTSWAADGFSGSYAGDYIGIDMLYCNAVPVWTDNRTGVALAYTSPFSLDCPADLVLCNADIYDNAMYSVTNNITIAGGTCSYIVHSTGDAVYRAGNEIQFNPGFEAQLGSEVDAAISATCLQYCDKDEFFAPTPIVAPGPGETNETVTSINNGTVRDGKAASVAYPNPAADAAAIRYYVSTPGQVSIVLHNAFGDEIVRLVDKAHQQGTYVVQLDATELASGMYYYTYNAPGISEMHKLVVLK